MERAVQLRLARGERHVLAELFEELAIGAAEAFRLSAAHDQCAEERVFSHEGRDHNGAQSALRQTLEQGNRQGARIGLVNELAAEAGGQPIRVEKCVTRVYRFRERASRIAVRTRGPERLQSERTRTRVLS